MCMGRMLATQHQAWNWEEATPLTGQLNQVLRRKPTVCAILHGRSSEKFWWSLVGESVRRDVTVIVGGGPLRGRAVPRDLCGGLCVYPIFVSENWQWGKGC